MKTTFDLPDPLLRKAKAAAADQGRPLRDLVAEALVEKLAALALAKGARKSRNSEWKAFEAKLEKLPDGTYINPEIPDEDRFAEILETIREERLGWQPWRQHTSAAAAPSSAAHRALRGPWSRRSRPRLRHRAR